MKSFKKILVVLFGVMVAFFLFLLWYQNRYAMEVVIPYSINQISFKKKLLIAAQGSNFKDEVATGIVDYFKSDSIYIKVLDIKELQAISPEDFDAIIVMHTWEYGKPPTAVKEFIHRTEKYKNRIVVVTTSGEGSYKMENVDAIVGESILEDTPVFVDAIIRRLTPLLK